jgi:hypothetical protein
LEEITGKIRITVGLFEILAGRKMDYVAILHLPFPKFEL